MKNEEQSTKQVTILAIEPEGVEIPLFESGVSAGLPMSVHSFTDSTINLSDELIRNKKTTFAVRVNGQSMVDAGIEDKDLLIVDKALDPQDKQIVLAVINGDFTVKRLIRDGDDLYLQAENASYAPIKINENMDFRIWGVVLGVIKKMI
ncbi:MAG: translesion error-prone DNA polymerase V autoproteolytic subunit [Flavobacteriales bacterium]|nr:translesion error-prone DNA polymerase V autoproteolytic subunit [Flavobacteriales bacterium]